MSGLPFPPLGDLPDPGIEPVSPESPALAGGFFTTEPPGELFNVKITIIKTEYFPLEPGMVFLFYIQGSTFFLKTLWFTFAFSLIPVPHCLLSIKIFQVCDKVKSMTGRLTIIGMWKRLLMKSEVKLQKIQYHTKISCGSLTASFLCPWLT